ncbi:MAG: rhomboid family intramembrane serine protease [Polyangiaceae bacterium]|nr:rhomboid family intramembrane serine protease [Polyangiaceae bacterium]
MHLRTSRPPALVAVSAFLVAAFVAIVPATARAAGTDGGCTQDSDCAKGFSCQVSGVSGCPKVACPTPAADGAAPECDPCTPVMSYSCQPASCTTDADCGSGMACITNTSGGCSSSGVACAPGDECLPPSPPTCTTTTSSVCTFRYNLPCTQDADCGDNFTCTPYANETCGTSAGTTGVVGIGTATPAPPTAPIDAQAAPPPAADDASIGCTTTTLSTSHCVPHTITCSADTDCPATWTCPPAPLPSGPRCAAAPDGSTAGCVDVGATPVASPSTCEPPYYNGGPAGPNTAGSSETLGVSGSGSGSGGSSGSRGSGNANTDAGATAPATAPGPRGNTGAAQTSEGAPPPAANGDGPRESDGGCQMGPAPATGASGALFALLGALVVFARRRKHA